MPCEQPNWPRLALTVFGTLALSWWSMMALHELGHALHAWVSGGVVTAVELSPLAISRTDVSPNPHPLWVAWGGAVWGCAIPVAIWLVARWIMNRDVKYLRFFAGFCLIANGAYLSGGGWMTAGDVADMARHGCPKWVAFLIGAAMLTVGLLIWHGLGSRFGLMGNEERIATSGGQ